MGILNLFSKSEPANLDRLPEGSFTVDSRGEILTSTVPHWFAPDRVRDIGQRVLAAFKSARAIPMPLSEITLSYGAFKITARELKGGALVFLSARQPGGPSTTQT